MLCVHDSLMTFHYYRNGFRQHYFDSIRNIGKNISPPVIEPLIKMAFTTICGSESRPETLAHSHSLTDTPPTDHLSPPYSSTSFRPLSPLPALHPAPLSIPLYHRGPKIGSAIGAGADTTHGPQQHGGRRPT